MLLATDRPGPRRRASPFGCSAALHLCVVLALAYPVATLTSGEPATGPGSDPIVVFTTPSVPVGPADAPAREADAAPDDLGIELPPGVTSVRVEGFTFDFATVVGRAASLFPFLQLPRLDDLARAGREDARAPLRNPLLPSAERGAAKPPLVLTARQLQSLTDKAWSRRDRWRAYQDIVGLANRHDANTGQLPDLLRAYVDQNLLQLFVDTTIHDPRLWAQLSVAADHRDFIAFVLDYASRHPGTKGRTELLFLLDKLAQSNLHALITLLDSNPPVQLQATRASSADAYRALVTMRRHYATELERLGLGPREALVRHYDEIRLTILGSIVRTTPGGYRAGDARYLIGAIQWEQGRRTDAVQTWREIEVEPSDTYASACSSILAAIRAAGGAPVPPSAVERSLAREHSRWVASSIDRLLAFGYRVDRF